MLLSFSYSTLFTLILALLYLIFALTLTINLLFILTSHLFPLLSASFTYNTTSLPVISMLSALFLNILLSINLSLIFVKIYSL